MGPEKKAVKEEPKHQECGEKRQIYFPTADSEEEAERTASGFHKREEQEQRAKRQAMRGRRAKRVVSMMSDAWVCVFNILYVFTSSWSSIDSRDEDKREELHTSNRN